MRSFIVILLFSVCSIPVNAQEPDKDSLYVREHYEKAEYQVPMRDGKKLFTVVYMPKDQSKTWPILMNRTCYNASSYANYKLHGHPSRYLVEDGYILVFQDVRGRYMSDGELDRKSVV